jgi:type VI secretion system protein VasD
MSLRRLPLLLLLGSMLLAGCASGPKPPGISAAVSANAAVNPDARNRPSPIVVRIYELKSPATFESADFFSLFEKDRETLAADLLARDEFVLRPGESKTIEREGKPETRYIAVLAGFREVERSVWRATAPLVGGQKNIVKITLDARAVSITAGK